MFYHPNMEDADENTYQYDEYNNADTSGYKDYNEYKNIDISAEEREFLNNECDILQDEIKIYKKRCNKLAKKIMNTTCEFFVDEEKRGDIYDCYIAGEPFNHRVCRSQNCKVLANTYSIYNNKFKQDVIYHEHSNNDFYKGDENNLYTCIHCLYGVYTEINGVPLLIKCFRYNYSDTEYYHLDYDKRYGYNPENFISCEK